MMLWLILTVMTWVAAIWLAVPFLRRLDPPCEEAASDVAVYRDQLQEIERDLTDGRIDDAQAETARIEIKRRILAANQPQQSGMPGLSGWERGLALVGSTGILVLGSIMLYAVTGSPDLAATGAVQRGTAPLPPQHPPLEGFASTDRAHASGSDDEPSSQAGLPTVEEMTQRLAARLARNPGDIEGWRTLGWSYLNTGRFTEADEAYAKAIMLDPGNTEFLGGRIEALVGAADGIVTAEAKAAIAATLLRDPKDVRARYFDGLARQQEGDKAAALAEWTELLKEGSDDERPGQSWASGLRDKIGTLRRDIGLDGGAVSDVPRLTGAGRQTAQAAEATPVTDRVAMIRGMVDGLASRLERSPRDADGWIKLMRSRIVLGESELARQALAHGLAVFADDAPEHDRIAAAAQQLGVGP